MPEKAPRLGLPLEIESKSHSTIQSCGAILTCVHLPFSFFVKQKADPVIVFCDVLCLGVIIFD